MKKIAIDRGPLASGHKVRGVGVYTRELIRVLEQESKTVKELKIKAINIKKENLSEYDLVHYTSFHPYFLTLPFNKKAKTIVTIHDLIPLVYPKQYAPGIKGRIRFLLQRYLINNVDGIITVSETSKKDIVRFLGVPARKIKVIYEAPRSIFKPITNYQELNTVKRKYNLPSRFVLYVGDVNYNKNIMGLIKACKIARVHLVICGKQAKDIEELGLGLDVLKGPSDWARFILDIPHPELAHFKGALKEFQTNKKIVRPGFIPDEDLVAVYNLASVYCQPSFYEGFGLPVLEAMACDTPVVCAKTQALVEVAADSALYANPEKPREIAKQINKAMRNPASLKLSGVRRVKEFSWAKTAHETINFYQEILGE